MCVKNCDPMESEKMPRFFKRDRRLFHPSGISAYTSEFCLRIKEHDLIGATTKPPLFLLRLLKFICIYELFSKNFARSKKTSMKLCRPVLPLRLTSRPAQRPALRLNYPTPRYSFRMSSSQALVCRPSNGKNHLSLESVPTPSLARHQVLVRTKAVAQNPTDVKSFDDNNVSDGAVLGCDFCGRVEKLGSDVTRVKVGDRIGGLIFPGEKKGVGAYAEYTVADEKICFKVPEAMSSEAAATIPLALTTAWLAMLSPFSLGMDRNQRDGNQMLIWGGSSSVGQYAIQIARHYGFEFATTCTNAELVKGYLGVEKHVFNYRSPTVVEDIKTALPGITYVLDCIGTDTSSIQASKTVCDAGGVLTTVRPGKAFTENIEPRVRATDVIVWTAFFKEINYRGLNYPVRSA